MPHRPKRLATVSGWHERNAGVSINAGSSVGQIKSASAASESVRIDAAERQRDLICSGQNRICVAGRGGRRQRLIARSIAGLAKNSRR
jgi:hypothetical protein